MEQSPTSATGELRCVIQSNDARVSDSGRFACQRMVEQSTCQDEGPLERRYFLKLCGNFRERVYERR